MRAIATRKRAHHRAGRTRGYRTAGLVVVWMVLMQTIAGRINLPHGQETCRAPSRAGADYALEFDGADDYVLIPPNPNLDLRDSLTVSAWVQSHGDDDGQIFWRGDTRAGFDPYCLHVHDNGKMEFRVDATGGNVRLTAKSRSPLDGAFHFWTGVKDTPSGKPYLYKDGELEATTNTTQTINYDTSAMWNVIGALDFGNKERFDGVIDGIQLWNRALTQDEVRHYMYRAPRGDEPGLVGYWNFNEGSGQVVHDGSGHGADGMLGQSSAADATDPRWVASSVPVQTAASPSWILYP